MDSVKMDIELMEKVDVNKVCQAVSSITEMEVVNNAYLLTLLFIKENVQLLAALNMEKMDVKVVTHLLVSSFKTTDARFLTVFISQETDVQHATTT